MEQLIKCENCGEENSNELTKCFKCGCNLINIKAKRNLIKRHLNYTWTIFYILIIIAFSGSLFNLQSQPMPTLSRLVDSYIPYYGLKYVDGKMVEYEAGRTHTYESKTVIDYDKRRNQIINLYFVYLIPILILSGLVLKQKGRSLHWLWVTFFFNFTPLIVGNKKIS